MDLTSPQRRGTPVLMSAPLDPRSGIVAFDPGVNGAWAVLHHSGRFAACGELPRFEKGLNALALGELVRSWRPARAAIEQVHSMPKQGVASTFTFGTAYGVCIGVTGGYGVPLTFVTPNRWKAHFRLNGKPKDASREIALRLFPEATGFLTLVKHHGRADALLIARFVLDTEAGRKFA